MFILARGKQLQVRNKMSIVLQFCCDIVEGEVQTYADLPPAADHLGEIWAVLTSTGIWPFNKVAGFYISNGVTWNVFSAFNFPSISATSPITFDTSTGEISTSIATNKLVGRSTSGSGVMEQITIGSGLNLSAGTLTSTGSGGTVTNVSVTTANGVSGSVANPTTTPAITLTLGAITPSSVAASGTLSGSNFSGSSSGTNTGDQDLSPYTLGAASSTDLAIAIFDGTSGKQIKNSLATVGSDGTITSKGILVDGNQNSSVNIICSNADTTDASSRARIVANALHPVLGMIGSTNAYGLHLDPDDSYNLKEIFSSVTISSPFRVVDRATSATKFPLQPSFSAYNSTFRTDVTGSGQVYQIICDTSLSNVGSSYNTSTGIFTAPISGTYLFTAGVGLGGINTTTNNLLIFGLQSTDDFLEISQLNVNSTTMTVSGSKIVLLDAGDTIYPSIQVNGSATGIDVRNAARITNFSGYLLPS